MGVIIENLFFKMKCLFSIYLERICAIYHASMMRTFKRFTKIVWYNQGDYDGRGQQTASPMLTAIMSGGVGISGRESYKYR